MLQIKCKLFPGNVYGVHLNLFFIVYFINYIPLQDKLSGLGTESSVINWVLAT